MSFLLSAVGLLMFALAIFLLFTQVKKNGFSLRTIIGAWIPVMTISIVFFFLSASIFDARDGFSYRVVNPNGTKYAITEPGWKIVNPWAKIQEWNKFIDIKTITVNNAGEYMEDIEGIEGVIAGAIPIRFTDQVTGAVDIAVRVQIPEDDDSFLDLAEEFRHPKNLINNTLIPTVREQVINTSYLFSAEGYVNGEAGEYRQTIDDALKNGGFKVAKVEVPDTVYAENFGTSALERERTIKEIKISYETEKVLDSQGVPIRYEHDINKNKLIISQAIVEALALEPKFKEKLEQQRDIAATKSIEADKIEQAKITQKRIIAEGERDKASERVAKEKQQISTLIAIETKVKEEESKRQLAEIALKTSKLDAQRRKVDADAKRYELQQADGLSEEAKYRIDAGVKESIGVAEAIAGPNGLKLPTTTVNGGDGNGQTDLTTLLLLKMLEGK